MGPPKSFLKQKESHWAKFLNQRQIYLLLTSFYETAIFYLPKNFLVTSFLRHQNNEKELFGNNKTYFYITFRASQRYLLPREKLLLKIRIGLFKFYWGGYFRIILKINIPQNYTNKILIYTLIVNKNTFLFSTFKIFGGSKKISPCRQKVFLLIVQKPCFRSKCRALNLKKLTSSNFIGGKISFSSIPFFSSKDALFLYQKKY